MKFERRKMVQLLAAFGVGAAGYPLVSYLSYSLRPEVSVAVASTVVDDVTTFPVNSSRRISFNGHVVLLVRPAENEWVALEGNCSHMGCLLHYDPAGRRISCPCHRGIYDLTGKVLEGPPPTGLKRYPLELKDQSLVLYN